MTPIDEVETFFRHLVDVLSKSDANRLRSPIQVSELYLTIVPYRRHRAALGFATHEDYEMAILRFLAGEGGFASLDPPEAQEALMEEARSVNPTPGAFREFAAAKVYLNSGAVRTVTDAHEAYAPPPPQPEPEDEAETFEEEEEEEEHEEETVDDDAPPTPVPPAPIEAEAVPEAAPATVEAPPAPPAPPAPTTREELEDFEVVGAVTETPEAVDRGLTEADQLPAATPAPAPTPAESPKLGAALMCHYCGGDLPPEREVHFCPYCGRDVTMILCPSCGAERKLDWRYCITCGDPVEQ